MIAAIVSPFDGHAHRPAGAISDFIHRSPDTLKMLGPAFWLSLCVHAHRHDDWARTSQRRMCTSRGGVLFSFSSSSLNMRLASTRPTHPLLHLKAPITE